LTSRDLTAFREGGTTERNNMRRKPVIVLQMLLWLGTSALANDMSTLIETVIDGASNDTQRAGRLVDAAKLVKENPKAQIAFCRKAIGYGLKTPSGRKHALTAIDILQQVAPGRMTEWLGLRTEVYRRSYRASRGTERAAVGNHLLNLLMRTGETRLAEGKASESISLFREALTIAGTIRSYSSPQILTRMSEARKKIAVAKRLETLRSAVKKKPTDASARKRLIMFCLFDLDMPSEAARHLNEDVDESLRTYVGLTAKPIEKMEPTVCLELGQWYQAQASSVSLAGKFVALTRAMKYYEHCLAKAQDNDLEHVKAKLKAKAALDKIVKQLSKLGGSALPKGAVDILTFDRTTIIRKGETTCARDLSGAGNNATLVGVKLVKGIAGQAVSISGKGSYVDTRFANKPTPKTVVLWAKSNKANPSNSMFFGHYDSTKTGDRFYVGFSSNSGQLGLGLGKSGWSNGTAFKVDTAWHHYAIVWTGSVMSVYVDARLQGAKKGKTVAGGEYYIGAIQIMGRHSGYQWNGLIDEFAIFDRPLTYAEIKKIYGLGRSGKSLKR